MAASISRQLEELLNPLPSFRDPEDDQDEATIAKVIDNFDEGDDDGTVDVSKLRNRASVLLSDTDKRYAGKATSRKALEQETGEDSFPEESEADVSQEEMEEEDEREELNEDEEQEDVDDESGEVTALSDKMKKPNFSFQNISDFDKFTQGMDDVGGSDDSGEEDEEEEEEKEGDDDKSEEEDVDEGGEQDHGPVMTFSKEKVTEEVKKGQSVKKQMALWDHVLESRIQLQKALLTANQLPQPDIFPTFQKKGGREFATALKDSHKALKALLRSLVELQDEMLFQYPDTKHFVEGKKAKPDSDEEITSDDEMEKESEAPRKGPLKRKLEMDEYPDFMAKRFADLKTYRNATLQKWHDKTKLASGKMGKGFSAFERSVLTQIEQIMMDKERLLQRTQTKRSLYRILGKMEEDSKQIPEQVPGEMEVVPQGKSNAHLKDIDEEIFDDDDFYHQLLRELIERKTSAVDPNDQIAMGRQWLAIQRLRSKIKRKVDTKASKGRKVRYHVHNKLVSFMAPIDHSAMNDEARTELYKSLFGKIKPAEAEIFQP